MVIGGGYYGRQGCNQDCHPTRTEYWLLLAGMMVCYVLLTQVVKTWFVRRFGA